MLNNHFYSIDDIACWNIFYEYFVFKLDERDVDSKQFHVLKIKDNQIIPTKIKDIFNDNSQIHLGVSSKNFFIANDNQIKILSLKEKSAKDNNEPVSEQDFDTYHMAPNTKLHGFFENRDSHKGKFLLLILENSQHIIGFAKMWLSEKGEPGKPKVQFQLYREIFQPARANLEAKNDIDYFKMYINMKTVEVDPKERLNKNDPKSKEIEIFVGASRRVTGKVDFYFNY